MAGQNLINSCESCTVRWKNFRNLTPDEMELINRNRYEATFKPGEIMVKQGSPASNVLFMSNGLCKSYVEGLNGKNFILEIQKPGKLIMGPGTYVNMRHANSVSAMTTVNACFISTEVFRQLVRENGAFAVGLIEYISEQTLKLQTRMVNLTQKRMSGRLAEILLYLSTDVFGSDDFDMILSRQELGEMTSMAKECVVRLLKEFEESGVIYSDASRIKILNREQLEQISEKG